MMGETCAHCERRIKSPETVNLCLGEHPTRPSTLEAGDILTLHDSCPCPVHGWDAPREYLLDQR